MVGEQLQRHPKMLPDCAELRERNYINQHGEICMSESSVFKLKRLGESRDYLGINPVQRIIVGSKQLFPVIHGSD